MSGNFPVSYHRKHLYDGGVDILTEAGRVHRTITGMSDGTAVHILADALALAYRLGQQHGCHAMRKAADAVAREHDVFAVRLALAGLSDSAVIGEADDA